MGISDTEHSSLVILSQKSMLFKLNLESVVRISLYYQLQIPANDEIIYR